MKIVSNEDVYRLLDVAEAIPVLEDAFQKYDTGISMERPRLDMYVPCAEPNGYWRWGSSEGAHDGIFALRMKSDVITWPDTKNGRTEEKYCVAPGTWCGLVMLFSTYNGEPLAFLNDGAISHMRTGASAAIGAKYLSRPESATVGLIGSGGMARTYLAGFAAVRPITSCKVFSPTRANRERFAVEMSAKLGIEVTAVASAEEAVRGSDIVASCTDTMSPTVRAEWLEPGMHVTDLCEEEIDDACLAIIDVKIRQGEGGLPLPESDRVKRLIGHSPVAYVAGSEQERKRLPSPPAAAPKISQGWPNYCDLVFGRARGRQHESDITFYHNFGNQGLAFAAVGGYVYRKAVDAGLGRDIPTEWFLESLRN